jgi:hypothetical protein
MCGDIGIFLEQRCAITFSITGQRALFVITCTVRSVMMFVDSCIIVLFIKKKSNKMQQCIKISLFPIYMKLNMFRATHRLSSGA